MKKITNTQEFNKFKSDHHRVMNMIDNRFTKRTYALMINNEIVTNEIQIITELIKVAPPLTIKVTSNIGQGVYEFNADGTVKVERVSTIYGKQSLMDKAKAHIFIMMEESHGTILKCIEKLMNK